MRLYLLLVLVLMLLPGAAQADSPGPRIMGYGDLNGDGLDDVLLRPSAESRGGIAVFYQQPGEPGTLQFGPGRLLVVGEQELSIAPTDPALTVQDVNRDGKGDLVFEQNGRRLAYYQLGTDGADRVMFSAATPLVAMSSPAVRPANPAPAGLGAAPPAVRTANPAPAALPPLDAEIIPPLTPMLGVGSPAVRTAAPNPVTPPAATGPGIVVPPPAPATPALTPAPAITRTTLAPPQAAGATIAIIDFTNDARDQGLDWLRQGAPDVLAMAIPASPAYEVLPRKRFLDVELRLDNVDEVFRGVKYVVKGNYWLEGESLVFDVAVVDMEIVDIIKGFSLRGERGTIASLMEQLEQQVKEYFATGFPPAR